MQKIIITALLKAYEISNKSKLFDNRNNVTQGIQDRLRSLANYDEGKTKSQYNDNTVEVRKALTMNDSALSLVFCYSKDN